MIADRFDAFPAAHRDIAREALIAAFGAAPIGAIATMTGGMTTASVYRVDVGARNYLLRVEGEPSPLRNPHQYRSMAIAAEARIAPAIHYVDEAARVVVMDFVEQVPLKAYSGGPTALARALGDLFSRVQATPVFPYYVNYPDIVTRLFAHVRRTGLFADGVLDPHVERLELLSKAYEAGATKPVSSHNDPTPGNILFDGERLWLIDWESACRNDPLIDVAIVLDGLVRTPVLEEIFLNAWLGRAPDDDIRVRLEVTRALTRLYYAGFFFSSCAAAPWKGDTDLSVPSLADFQQAIQAGRLKPGTPEIRYMRGKMFLASFLSGASTPGFGGAVL
jgi:aminoglycoside phosphotransferase (APT) family kinase protein